MLESINNNYKMVIVPPVDARIMKECVNSMISRDFNIIPVKHFDGLIWKECFAFNQNDDSIEEQVNFIFKNTFVPFIFFQENSSDILLKLNRNGKKEKMSLLDYSDNGCDFTDIWSINDKLFCLKPQKDYLIINSKDQLVEGTDVEILNGENWIPFHVNNIEQDYERIFKLFIKYNRVRKEVQ